jgi:hypothetical protein
MAVSRWPLPQSVSAPRRTAVARAACGAARAVRHTDVQSGAARRVRRVRDSTLTKGTLHTPPNAVQWARAVTAPRGSPVGSDGPGLDELETIMRRRARSAHAPCVCAALPCGAPSANNQGFPEPVSG